MGIRRSPAACLKAIDEALQDWRTDDLDGPTMTLVRVDVLLAEYYGRKLELFPDAD